LFGESSQLVSSLISIRKQLLSLGLELANVFGVLFNSGAERSSAALGSPTVNLALHLIDTSALGQNLLTESAGLSLPRCFIDELQAARFAHAVLFVALAPHVSPLPALASVPDAIVKAHCQELGLYLH
jgi:hypothetical protein